LVTALVAAAGAPARTGAQQSEPPDPKLLGGTWESVYAKESPLDVNSKLRCSFFPKAGKPSEGTLKLAAYFRNDKASEAKVFYELKGDRLTSWQIQGDTKTTQTDKIIRLTPDRLVTQSEKGETLEYKKIK